MATLKAPLAALLLAPLIASCQFSVKTGGPDYEKLEGAITDGLNENYSSMSRQVSSVDCPRQANTPKAGDTFICKADLDGNPVRVQVTVSDDPTKVDFKTMDTVYDLSTTSKNLAKEISSDRGFAVTVTCGEGIKVVEIGQTFECVAADRRGDTRTVVVTAGAPNEGDRWRVIAEEGD